jgi:hypothetical protein
MRKTEILNSAGQCLIEWNGSDTWKTFQAGGFVASLEWAVLPGSAKAQRVCVIGRPREGVLLNAHAGTVQGEHQPRLYTEGDRPHILAFDKDDKPTGSCTRDFVWDAAQSVRLMGYTADDRTAVKNYIDLVLRAMIEMVYQPAAKPEVRNRIMTGGKSTFEVTATRNGQTTEALV